ncbi:hypothetical protein [Thermus antranikianii]|uniref:hypothetical protein n=1 Tax=Thermus antranikianii TaxID=88190 RepID=UPI001C76320D|nr:hypothetical protein [Thermus antranikianii]QWK23104.1 MAG: hypothetical protein KNN15_06665 [Thermus antranikianii]
MVEAIALRYARFLPPGEHVVYVHPHALVLAKAGYDPCAPRTTAGSPCTLR